MTLYRYEIETDEKVIVTQEWCDLVQKQLNILATQRKCALLILSLNVNENKELIYELYNKLNCNLKV